MAQGPVILGRFGLGSPGLLGIMTQDPEIIEISSSGAPDSWVLCLRIPGIIGNYGSGSPGFLGVMAQGPRD